MRSAKGHHQEEEEDEEEEFNNKTEGTSSNNNNNNNNNNKEPKSHEQKVNATRSKHSVTEQRRRSKINERFQILRDLIPHSDQKRDTASFLLEVIEYVQYLQEKVQKYEGSYQNWSAEPTKLMPWRNSHWRVQSFAGSPPVMKNGSGLISTLSGKFDENNISMNPSLPPNAQSSVEYDPSRDVACQVMDGQSETANRAMPLPSSLQVNLPAAVPNDNVLLDSLQRSEPDSQSTECHVGTGMLNQHEDLMIEGGTINISSTYSQGLLNTLTQALQTAGVDLSQASIAVQIDLGKRANKGPTSGASILRDHVNLPASNQVVARFKDASSGEESDHAQKRMKI